MPTKVFGDLIEIGNQRAHFIHNDNAAIFANLGPDDLPFNDPAIKARSHWGSRRSWLETILNWFIWELISSSGDIVYLHLYLPLYLCWHLRPGWNPTAADLCGRLARGRLASRVICHSAHHPPAHPSQAPQPPHLSGIPCHPSPSRACLSMSTNPLQQSALGTKIQNTTKNSHSFSL